MPLSRAILKTRYQLLPERFSITLTPKNPTGTPITGIAGVTRSDWDHAEISQYGGAGIEPDRISFIIPARTLEQVTTAKPIRGWWITDPDATWTIKGVTWYLLDTMYRCTCIKNV